MQFTLRLLVYITETNGVLSLYLSTDLVCKLSFSFLSKRFKQDLPNAGLSNSGVCIFTHKFVFTMKCSLFLYTESDSAKGRRLMNYFQGRLRTVANMRNIPNILVRKQDFRTILRRSECVVLVGTPQALSFIQNKQQEKDEDDILFDGKIIHEEFTENKELVKNRLVIVHFTKRTENDWIPTDFDEKRIFHVEDGNVPPKGTPTLTHLEYRMKKILLGDDFLY